MNEKEIREKVTEIFCNSFSRIDFAKNLKKAKITLWRLDGKIIGYVHDERKIDFNSIGLGYKAMERLDALESKVNHRVQKRIGRIERLLNISDRKRKKEKEKER